MVAVIILPRSGKNGFAVIVVLSTTTAAADRVSIAVGISLCPAFRTIDFAFSIMDQYVGLSLFFPYFFFSFFA